MVLFVADDGFVVETLEGELCTLVCCTVVTPRLAAIDEESSLTE